MAGNESEVIKFLLSRGQSIFLPHIGTVQYLSNPGPSGQRILLTNASAISTEDSSKKADIYINDIGVSIKQAGGSFAFNRIQRKGLGSLFSHAGVANGAAITARLDSLVDDFHNGHLPLRNQPWNAAFSEAEFKAVLKHLMLYGSPEKLSSHPATLILTAPAKISRVEQLIVQTFDEYYDQNCGSLWISIRRQWIGQNSNSEHSRACAIATNPTNSPWVYQSISGSPSTGWNANWPLEDRRTVYFLMLEKTT